MNNNNIVTKLSKLQFGNTTHNNNNNNKYNNNNNSIVTGLSQLHLNNKKQLLRQLPRQEPKRKSMKRSHSRIQESISTDGGKRRTLKKIR